MGRAFLWVVLLGGVGCADYQHESCTFSGSGFTLTDSCPWSERCVADVPRVLSDGSLLHTPILDEKARCSGPSCSSDSDCQSGYFCYKDGSRLHHCMPKDPRESVFLTCQDDDDCCSQSVGQGCYSDCSCQPGTTQSYCERD